MLLAKDAAAAAWEEGGAPDSSTRLRVRWMMRAFC